MQYWFNSLLKELFLFMIRTVYILAMSFKLIKLIYSMDKIKLL